MHPTGTTKIAEVDNTKQKNSHSKTTNEFLQKLPNHILDHHDKQTTNFTNKIRAAHSANRPQISRDLHPNKMQSFLQNVPSQISDHHGNQTSNFTEKFKADHANLMAKIKKNKKTDLHSSTMKGFFKNLPTHISDHHGNQSSQFTQKFKAAHDLVMADERKNYQSKHSKNTLAFLQNIPSQISDHHENQTSNFTKKFKAAHDRTMVNVRRDYQNKHSNNTNEFQENLPSHYSEHHENQTNISIIEQAAHVQQMDMNKQNKQINLHSQTMKGFLQNLPSQISDHHSNQSKNFTVKLNAAHSAKRSQKSQNQSRNLSSQQNLNSQQNLPSPITDHGAQRSNSKNQLRVDHTLEISDKSQINQKDNIHIQNTEIKQQIIPSHIQNHHENQTNQCAQALTMVDTRRDDQKDQHTQNMKGFVQNLPSRISDHHENQTKNFTIKFLALHSKVQESKIQGSQILLTQQLQAKQNQKKQVTLRKLQTNDGHQTRVISQKEAPKQQNPVLDYESSMQQQVSQRENSYIKGKSIQNSSKPAVQRFIHEPSKQTNFITRRRNQSEHQGVNAVDQTDLNSQTVAEAQIKQDRIRIIYQPNEAHQKAQELIRRMNKQRQEQVQRKQEELLSLERQYKIRENEHQILRDQEAINAQNVKRRKIQEKLENEKNARGIKEQINADGNKLIKQIQINKIHQDQFVKQKDDEQLNSELLRRKVELTRKRELSQPIRQDSMKEHQKKYEDDIKLKKYERDSIKVNNFLDLQTKVHKYPRSEAQLKLEDEDRQERDKHSSEHEVKKVLKQRQQKYNEVVRDLFPVAQKRINEQIIFTLNGQKRSMQIHKDMKSMNIKSFQSDSQNLKKLERVLNRYGRSQEQLGIDDSRTDEVNARVFQTDDEMSQNYLQNIIPQTLKKQNINRSYQKKMKQQYDDPVSQKKSQDLKFHDESVIHKRPQVDYLKEMRANRLRVGGSFHEEEWERIIKNEAVPLDSRIQNVLTHAQKLEQRAKNIEQIAIHNRGNNAEEEADNLYVRSIHAKLALLNKKT